MSSHVHDNSPRVAVVQDGARGHYGVPIALQRANLLYRVYTDWYSGSLFSRTVGRAVRLVHGGAGQRMLDRQAPELDARKVLYSTRVMLQQHIGGLSRRSVRANHARISALHAAWIIRTGLGDANAVFGFVRNIDPELCGWLRQRNIIVVGDAFIAPGAVQLAEYEKQSQSWPGWEKPEQLDDVAASVEYENRTWPHLSHITCPSDYVREGLISQGISPSRVSVLHYPIDEGSFEFVDRSSRAGPMQVGFVGAVGLRKGAPYFFEVARHFRPDRVQFHMIGAVTLRPEIVAKEKGNVFVHGPVPRSQLPEWMRKFDAILFPSTCEGSAYALMEAMATGLPVVTSPNSGTVARHGIEGFIAPYDAIEQYVHHIESLATNPTLRMQMGQAARQRYEECSIDNYSNGLAKLFTDMLR